MEKSSHPAPLVIKNATLINEGRRQQADVLIRAGKIEKIASSIDTPAAYREIPAEGKWLLPGVIDDQVHFREPGLTHKASIETESRAAVAGGITSFMEMPNTSPPATTQVLLEEKYRIAADTSLANYSFFMGVANDNIEEVLATNKKKSQVCGIKIFMGSSTGNMLVDNYNTLNKIFADTALLIATHCEDERIIAANKARYPEADCAAFHPLIRDEEACFASSFSAVQLAKMHDARLHILHISTAKELQLFSNFLPLSEKRITAEVCVHHLHFTAEDYARLGTSIQCNPAIKGPEHKTALWEALLDNRLDIIATDHAPHTRQEKDQPYPASPSGLPLVQHALPLMLEYVRKGQISLEQVVDKMCHAPAVCFGLKDRGFIREGYQADLVLIDPDTATRVRKENILYKCGWSPFEGTVFHTAVTHTFVNGHPAFENGKINESQKGQRLSFDR